MSELTQYVEVVEILSRLNLRHSPAGWHGLLCGALCVDEARRIDVMHLAEGDSPSTADPDALNRLRGLQQQALAGLVDLKTPFAPLLPDDDEPLGRRATALAEWCEGFVFSLGGRHRFDLDACSANVREIVRDFTELTRATLSEGDDLEVEEGAYAELVEYIRVGAQLIFVELRRAAGNDASPPRHDASRMLH